MEPISVNVHSIPLSNYWVVGETISFESDYIGRRITVPCGRITDFASVPRALWWYLPPAGILREGAVFHDELYRSGEVERWQADRVFQEVLQYNRIPNYIIKQAFYGVRLGGWKGWRKHRKGIQPRVDIPQSLAQRIGAQQAKEGEIL